MKKGQIVSIKAYVMTGYPYDLPSFSTEKIIHEPKFTQRDVKTNLRCLMRFEYLAEKKAILIGKTTLQTGIREPEHHIVDDYDPPTFYSDKHHRVWVVVSFFETDQRYTKPFYVLEEDILQ